MSEDINEFFLDANSDIEESTSDDDEGSDSSDSSDGVSEDEDANESSMNLSQGSRRRCNNIYNSEDEDDSEMEIEVGGFGHLRMPEDFGSSDSDSNGNDPPPDQYAYLKDVKWKKGHPFVPQDLPCQNNTTQFNPTLNLNGESTPLDIFKKFVTEEMVEKVINETNRYAEQIKATKPSTLKKWKALKVGEFWLFFALHLSMGLVRKSAIHDYWKTAKEFSTPFFGQIMSRDRFIDILRCLHFANNDEANLADRTSKFGTFLSDLMENFKNAINPGEYLTIDESLLLYKGKLSIRQYIPSKRSRFGIKMFHLIDTASKFIIKSIIYIGKETLGLSDALIKEIGSGGGYVLELMEDFFYTGRKLTIDNGFMSPKLALYLLKKKIGSLGTVRSNRKEMPKFKKKLRKGQVETYSSSKLLLERWSDRREVLMLNTYLEHDMILKPSSNPNNTRMKPLTVLKYNEKMGSVDDVDRQTKAYASIRKSWKWYRKVIFHFMDLGISNSYRIYQSLHSNTKLNYKSFIETLITDIYSQYPVSRVPAGRPSTSEKEERLQGIHLPDKRMKLSDLEEYKQMKKECKLCKIRNIRKMTPFICLNCNISLCISGENSCFKQYHTLHNLNE